MLLLAGRCNILLLAGVEKYRDILLKIDDRAQQKQCICSCTLQNMHQEIITSKEIEKAAEFHSLPVLGHLDSNTFTVKLTVGEVIN